MNWTVGRRVWVGFTIELALLVIVAIVAGISLGRTTDSYELAMKERRTIVLPAQRAESEVRGANVEQLRFYIAHEDRYMRNRDSLFLSSRRLLGALTDSSTGNETHEGWLAANTLLTRLVNAMDSAVVKIRAGKEAEGLEIRRTQTEPIRSALDSVIHANVVVSSEHSELAAQRGLQTAQMARTTIIISAFIALLVGLISAFLLNRSISKPLQDTANVIAASSAQILAATTEQAAGTNESMAAVTETVATVDEVAQTATQSSQRARNVADAAQRAAEGGRAGRQAVEDSVAAMRLVQDQVEAMAKGIVALAEQAQAIGEITTAVSDIAEQTKLLALNAAVESTRAGEHGRGFALVAAEIKALAGEAKDSTVQVRRLLGEIQRATSAAVMATEQGTKQSAAAVRQVNQAGEVITQLSSVVDEAAQAAAQIVASAGQQALGMDQIRQAIANIHDATQQSLTATRQSEGAAQNLNALGNRLVSLVGAHRNV